MVQRLAVAAALMVAMFGLAGCAGAPSTVAEVGERRITTGDLEQMIADAERVLPLAEGEQISSRAVAAAMIGGAIATEVGARTGESVTPQERTEFVQSAQVPGLAELAANPEAAEIVAAFLDPAVLAEKLGPERYLEASMQIPLELNPAYGTWDYSTNGLDPLSNGSLSEPIGEPR